MKFEYILLCNFQFLGPLIDRKVYFQVLIAANKKRAFWGILKCSLVKLADVSEVLNAFIIRAMNTQIMSSETSANFCETTSPFWYRIYLVSETWVGVSRVISQRIILFVAFQPYKLYITVLILRQRIYLNKTHSCYILLHTFQRERWVSLFNSVAVVF